MKRIFKITLIIILIFGISNIGYAENTVNLSSITEKLLTYSVADRANMFYTVGNGYLISDIGIDRLIKSIENLKDNETIIYNEIIDDLLKNLDKDKTIEVLQKIKIIDEEIRRTYFKYFDRIVDENGNFSPKDEINLSPESEEILSLYINRLCDENEGLYKLMQEDGITVGVVARFLKIFCDMNDGIPLFTDSLEDADKLAINKISDKLKQKENSEMIINSLLSDLNNKVNFNSSFKKVLNELGIYIPKSTWQNPFSDVSLNDWYYEAVKFVNQNNLMKGTENTLFSPDSNVTRAMFVTVLYRLEGEPAFMNDNVFSDVPRSEYYEKAVVWAHGKEIVKGVSDTEFSPNSNITREQMAALIYRYLTYKGKTEGQNYGLDLKYTDSVNISDYAAIPFSYCVSCGIIKGKTETTLNPEDFATRAEIAVILSRIM